MRICLRMARILRSNAFWSRIDRLEATIAWRITGMVSMHGLAETGQVGRHIAPADHGLAFLGHELLEMLDDVLPRASASRGRKHMATA